MRGGAIRGGGIRGGAVTGRTLVAGVGNVFLRDDAFGVEVIRLLDADAIVCESLAIREPTLDDVFLRLTGHWASTGPGEPASLAGGADAVQQGSAS